MRAVNAKRGLWALLISAFLLSALGAASAQAASPAWRALAVTGPTHLAPESSGEIAVFVTNVGGAPSDGTPIKATFELPAGIVPSSGGFCTATGQSVLCSQTAVVSPSETLQAFALPVVVGSMSGQTIAVDVTVEGGGGVVLHRPLQVVVSSIPATAGIDDLWAGAFDADGVPDERAGGHPHSAGLGFRVNTIKSPLGHMVPAGTIRDLHVGLPPGFLGNATVTKRCPTYDVGCDPDAVVGLSNPLISDFAGNGSEVDNQWPVFSFEPPPGFAAGFTFKIAEAKAEVFGTLRSDEDYGVELFVPNLQTTYQVFGAVTVLNGLPAASGGKPFLTNPTECAEQSPVTSLVGNTWQVPDLFEMVTTPVPAMSGCANLAFTPSFTFQPSATTGSTPVATTAHLHVDQSRLLEKDKLAPPHLKDSVVTLPEGLNLNPSAANGLQACTTQQIGFIGGGFPMPNPTRFTKDSPSCPEASKVGTATVETPLLDDPLQGTVYLASQGDNPFGSLIALYLVIDDAKTGVTAKLPGKVVPDPKTGQLTATFENNPQLPFEDLTLSFRGGGPRSTLATPDVCGAYETKGSWTPWSAPESGPASPTTDSFTVSGNCSASKASRPFDLGFTAGTTDPTAAKHSPFTLRITRPDGNQELDKISATVPPGLLATLKGVEICSDAAISKATSRGNPGDGAKEISDPSCPSSSQVGTTTIGAGVGSEPIYVKTGHVYLTGPYKDAPASLTFIVPAVAGPFDLGVQVVRTALNVDPKTAQVTAVSDSIPQILAGIPVQIRDVIVDVDRSGFILNPTDCSELAVTAKVTGGSGAVSNLSNRFQVDGCKSLPFKPKLKLALKGSPKRASYQRLTATLTAKPGEANISRTAVTMPHSIFLAQEHIRTVCTRVQFAADNCPKASIYGSAEAATPLLDGKVQGPVYLRSSDNPLPDLVAALKGPDNQPIEVELAGRTDSVHGGIRNTFDVVPDAPVSKFTLKLYGGQKSLLISSRNLCKGGRQKATVRMSAHNGRRHDFRPALGIDCGKKKGKARGK